MSDTDPIAWQIFNVKLYLNYDNRVQRIWANELERNIELSDRFWPELVVAISEVD